MASASENETNHDDKYEPRLTSLRAITTRGTLYRFIMWRFSSNYGSISFLGIFTINLGRSASRRGGKKTALEALSYLIMAYFPKQVEITKFHR